MESHFPFIECPLCGFAENTTTKIIQDVKTFDTLFEIGVLCEQCLEWTHCFYLTGRLRDMRQKMDKLTVISNQHPEDMRLKNKAKRVTKSYKKQFANLQKMMKRKKESEATNVRPSIS
jgi:hypothetical protein